MKGSKREQRRLAAAEEVCRAVRKALSHSAMQNQYMNVALDWILVWIKNSPAKVWQSDPALVVKRKSLVDK
jgi:hypothetical protein